jgi:flagellin
MDISSVGGSNPYTNIASGQRINSAADDPSGLAIAKGMEAQTSSSKQNINNVANMSNLLNTADGALESISNNLQRLRELSVQASNGILSQDDKKIIQGEVSQVLSEIESVASSTSFNQMKILDGSFTEKNTASSTDGSGPKISIDNTSLESLGIKGFDVSKGFDISKIDEALSKVSESRSEIGSATNAFKHATNNISGKINNITSSMSKIQDANISMEISTLKKNQILDQYKMQMQAMLQNNQRTQTGMMADFKL